MNVTWARTAAPATELFTTAEAKVHLKVDHGADDALIGTLIEAARDHVEELLGRGLFTQTWKLVQDEWSDVMWLPRAAPLVSVSSVQYYAADGVLTALSSSYYTVDSDSEPGRIALAPTYSWPVLQSGRINRVEITYVVGWVTVAAIPQAIKQAILLQIEAWYYRNDALIDAVKALLAPYKVWWRPPCEGSV